MGLGDDYSETKNLNDEALERRSSTDGIKLESNGSNSNENVDEGSGSVEINCSREVNGNEIGNQTPTNTKSPLEVAETPEGVSGETPPTRKGFGLKKWRRIRRDFVKDESAGLDLNRILKRGAPNAAEIAKPRDSSAEIKLKSEGSAASEESSVKSPDLLDGFVPKGSSLDSTVGVGSAFAFGTDSENSGDRSSKSSTAASAPRMRNDFHTLTGSARDKHKVKNLSGRSSSNSVQKVQQVKGKVDTSKKSRGERDKYDNENSYSSIESDLRSPNIVFSQIGAFGNSNRRQSEVCSNYDEENSEKGQTSDLHAGDGDQKGYCKQNGCDIEDISQNDVSGGGSLEEKGEEIESNRTHAEWDPLVKSIISLQAVQEALEIEIEKFGELGNEPVLPSETDINLSPQLQAEVVDLTQKVNGLERELEEASYLLKEKELRVVELEQMLNRTKLHEEEKLENGLPSVQDECREMESQLEDLFKQKIEAEIEHLIIATTTQNLEGASEAQSLLFEEQKSLSEEQNQMLQKLRVAERKATVLKKHVNELDASCEEMICTEEILIMQNRVCKHTLCFFVQLMLLFIGVMLFMLQLYSQPSGDLPT
ncbi:hypothetical protein MKW98_024939 [Papaver atlanticum]|uniref:WPP domain-interacting protein 2 n=1 Tax=Papaver atlanticum TaxID=357466 RepID=A0AAD4T8I4_9MAGN|nr:hypothetical protein MKW98_024939 [Papaver atlanticum]